MITTIDKAQVKTFFDEISPAPDPLTWNTPLYQALTDDQKGLVIWLDPTDGKIKYHMYDQLAPANGDLTISDFTTFLAEGVISEDDLRDIIMKRNRQNIIDNAAVFFV